MTTRKPDAFSQLAIPKEVTDPSLCVFYHTMDIPGLGTVTGEWDLRQTAHIYLGEVDLRGKRVLDVGTTDGFLCFYAEQQGASSVVALDLSPKHDWDIVPFAGSDTYAALQARKAGIEKLNNAFWLAHRLLSSKAGMIYGDVYSFNWPSLDFDVAIFGAILLHLRDPFLALQRILPSVRETVIVAELLWPTKLLMYIASSLFGRPMLQFLPDPKTKRPVETWWAIPPATAQRWLAVLGFETQKVSYHRQKHRRRWHWMYTIVAQRKPGLIQHHEHE